MIKLRVSSLEAYRRIQQTRYGDEEELVESIQRGQWEETVGSWQAEAGTAWHTAISDVNLDLHDWIACTDREREELVDDRWLAVKVGNFAFSANAIRLARQKLGTGIQEFTGRKAFAVGRHEVQVQGKCDLLAGHFLRDVKAKFSSPDSAHYEKSLQWRFYLAIFGGEKFTFDLFHFREPKAGFCFLKEHVSFSFWRYPGLEDDCRGWIVRFLEWAESRRLMGHLVQGEKQAV